MIVKELKNIAARIAFAEIAVSAFVVVVGTVMQNELMAFGSLAIMAASMVLIPFVVDLGGEE